MSQLIRAHTFQGQFDINMPTLIGWDNPMVYYKQVDPSECGVPGGGNGIVQTSQTS